MGDTLFAVFHFLLVLGAVGLAVYYLAVGNLTRFVIMSVCLALYYFLVLHKAVKKEIERKKQIKKKAR